VSNIDPSEGAGEELERIIGGMRDKWPEMRIIGWGDSEFCREGVMSWCEGNGVDYVFGKSRPMKSVATRLCSVLCRCQPPPRFDYPLHGT
jgi:hypothetical protein